MQPNLLMVLTGLSGSGKTTLCTRLLTEIEAVERVITTTTRAPRPGEVHGKDYHFETLEHFQKRLKADEFLEHAQVYENFYGVSKSAILNPALEEKDLVICMDVQGAQTLKKNLQDFPIARRLITIFVAPSSLKELEMRLIKRGTDDAPTIQKRLQMAEKELSTLSQFDYHLCSQDKAHDWQCLRYIYFAEKMRI